MKPVTKAIVLAILSVIGLVISCKLQAQAGMYNPTVTAHNTNIVSINTVPTRYFQNGNEVIVSGMFSVTSFNNSGQVASVTLSLPISGTPANVYGQMTAFQSGGAPVPGVVQSAGSTYTIRWFTNNTMQANIYFLFTYTNQP